MHRPRRKRTEPDRPVVAFGEPDEMRGVASYNRRMPTSIIGEMKDYIGFDDRDAAWLKSLEPVVRPHLARVVERFYAQVLKHPGARRVLAGGEAQVERLRGHLANWVGTLFCGQYDEQYVRQRAGIGHVHVRIGLPQHYMFGALEVIRQELSGIILSAGVPECAEKQQALCKLLTIETGIMLESYKNSYADRIRQAEHDAIQERLSRAEHLAEVGQMAASLAHEIKNPLAGISGAIQVLRDEMDREDPRRNVLVEVLRQIGRLDNTVKDLLTYARPHPPRFKNCDLESMIERVAGLMRQEPAYQNLALEYDCTDVDPIEADEHQVEQVLVNLLLNAAHASDPGAAVRLRIAADAEEVVLVIEDRGHGMDEDLCRRAFEPFFTTKARGTGLGLPICRRIIDAHGGSIAIHSEPGNGTAVEVRLPIRQRARESAG